MTRAEVETIVAHARALIEAHERRFPGYGFATEGEAQAINLLVMKIVETSEAEAARLQVA